MVRNRTFDRRINEYLVSRAGDHVIISVFDACYTLPCPSTTCQLNALSVFILTWSARLAFLRDWVEDFLSGLDAPWRADSRNAYLTFLCSWRFRCIPGFKTANLMREACLAVLEDWRFRCISGFDAPWRTESRDTYLTLLRGGPFFASLNYGRCLELTSGLDASWRADAGYACLTFIMGRQRPWEAEGDSRKEEEILEVHVVVWMLGSVLCL